MPTLQQGRSHAVGMQDPNQEERSLIGQKREAFCEPTQSGNHRQR